MRLLGRVVVAVALSGLGGDVTVIEGSSRTALGSPSQNNVGALAGPGGIRDHRVEHGRDTSDSGDEVAHRHSPALHRTLSRRPRPQRGRQVALLTLLGVAALSLSTVRLAHRTQEDGATVVEALEGQDDLKQAAPRAYSLVIKSLAAALVGAAVLNIFLLWPLTPAPRAGTYQPLAPGEDGILLGNTSSFVSTASESSKSGVRPVTRDSTITALQMFGVAVTVASALAATRRMVVPAFPGAGEAGVLELKPENSVERVEREDPDLEGEREDPDSHLGREAIESAVAHEALESGGGPSASKPDVQRDAGRSAAEQRSMLQAMTERLHPGGIGSLISTLRGTFHSQVSGGVLSRMEEYLKAIAETDNAAETAFRVARVVTILQLRRMSKLFGEVTAASEAARKASMAGEQPWLSHEQAARWTGELLDIGQKLEGARILAISAYPRTGPWESYAVRRYIEAEAYSLLLRRFALNAVLQNLVRDVSGTDIHPVDLRRVVGILRTADEKTKGYAAAVGDDTVLAGVAFSENARLGSEPGPFPVNFSGAPDSPQPAYSEGDGKRTEGPQQGDGLPGTATRQ